MGFNDKRRNIYFRPFQIHPIVSNSLHSQNNAKLK